MKKVLIFPASTELGLEIGRSLRYSKEFYAISASTGGCSKYLYKEHIELPAEMNVYNLETYNYLSTLDFDIILPAHDEAIVRLAEDGRFCGKLPTIGVVRAQKCRNKLDTYRFLKGKVLVPDVYDYKCHPYPCFVKPFEGQGSKGARLINNVKEDPHDKNLLYMENLTGTEITVDCFTNSKHELIFIGPRRRVVTSNGISVHTEDIADPNYEITAMAEEISERLMMRGAWFFQAIGDDTKGYTLLEVAPRIAGNSSHQRLKGINLTEMTLYDFLGEEVGVIKNDHIKATRKCLQTFAERTVDPDVVFLDFDDTLYLHSEESFNRELISFLYKWMIPTFIVSRHNKGLEGIKHLLAEDGISEDLFTELHVITEQKDSSKVDFIKSIIDKRNFEHPLFVDDSPRERLRVKHALPNIICLGPESIEVFLY